MRRWQARHGQKHAQDGAPGMTGPGWRARISLPIGNSPAVILVRPQLADNIGAVARAMANGGLFHLRLVAPRDGWPQEKAWRERLGRGPHCSTRRRVHRTSPRRSPICTTSSRRVRGPAMSSSQ